MYKKLLNRISTFFVQAERYRKLGPTEKQEKEFKESGFSFQYRVELHKCLKNLLLSLVRQKDETVMKFHLREVYLWFFNKLQAIGALSP